MRTLRPLTEIERSTLERELKLSREAGDWRRIFVILSYDEGMSVEELAKLTRLSSWTVEEYIKKYSSENKTKNDPRGGSSSKLSEKETKTLEKHLSSTTYLKVKDIIVYVKKTFGKQYSRSGMTAWLTQHGFTFKKPEKIPGRLNPEKQEQFIEEYNKLKASLDPSDELYFLDAVHPEYQSQAVCGWIKKGEHKTLQTTAKQQRLHFVGALNLKEMVAVIREYETIDAEAMIRFFTDLESAKSGRKIHVILDNAAAHKSRKLIEHLKGTRIQLHYLPPYSPNLNPIERLWKVFRQLTLYNRYFETCCEFFEVVRRFFAEKVHRIRQLLKQRINDNFQTIKLNPIKLG
ncbi:MAG: IS630 family transposase [Halobacteriovoraceae bacterium]|nr:IS630 family transposase [Halobacteriovoraceae bacterium]